MSGEIIGWLAGLLTGVGAIRFGLAAGGIGSKGLTGCILGSGATGIGAGMLRGRSGPGVSASRVGPGVGACTRAISSDLSWMYGYIHA